MKRATAAERERRILAAATMLFNERGFSRATVDEIGGLAGLTGPAIYRHFRGKDEILNEIFDRAVDRFLQIPVIDDDPDTALRQLLRRHATLVCDDIPLASVYVREERMLAEPSRRRLIRRQREYMDRWLTVLRRRFPDRADGDLVESAYLAVGLLNSVVHRPGAGPDQAALIDKMCTMAMCGLVGAAGELTDVTPNAGLAASA